MPKAPALRQERAEEVGRGDLAAKTPTYWSPLEFWLIVPLK